MTQGVVTAFVDQVARDKAQKALDNISGHEDLCAERYDNINDTLKTIKQILGWAGGTIFTMLLATLSWLLVQQVSHNDDDKQMLRDQVQMLQSEQMRSAAVPGSPAR
jgi:hypothetical protein